MSDDTKEKDDSKEEPADAVGLDDTPYESTNNSREETQAIMEASSPDDVDKDLIERIEEERKERLDPDNRPENAEVDNTQRTFIAEEARFEDSEISDEDVEDGIGQKEPDPETEAAAASKDSDDSDSDDDDGDGSGHEPDTDSEGEATSEEARSDASTGPEPTGDASKDAGKDDSEDDTKPGKHKA